MKASVREKVLMQATMRVMVKQRVRELVGNRFG